MKQEYSKIKNLIFDLDNTIILDIDEDVEIYKEALKELKYDPDDYYRIYEAIDETEEALTENDIFFTKEKALKHINEKINKNYKIEVIDKLSEKVGKYWTKNILLDEETAKYLARKYNLYVYTNFFEDAQAQRIQTIGYDKYFKRVFGADKVGAKPFKKGIENVLKLIETKPEECIMIGDSKNKEILSASKVGMQAILYDYDGMRDKKDIKLDNYIIIKDFKELLDIL